MNLEKYRTTIGVERLKSFCDINKDACEEYLVEKYIMNIKASQSLYPILSIVEVYLRNAIDVMLQALYGNDWLEKEIKKQAILFKYDNDKLQEAIHNLDRKYGFANVTRGKIIAELNFGFWVNLCSSKYNPKIWTKKNAFRLVFPRFPHDQKESIAGISRSLIKIKNLRNRVFHYEPIFKSDVTFWEIYDETIKIINYLPEGNIDIIKRTDNFGPTLVELTKMLLHAMGLNSKKL